MPWAGAPGLGGLPRPPCRSPSSGKGSGCPAGAAAWPSAGARRGAASGGCAAPCARRSSPRLAASRPRVRAAASKACSCLVRRSWVVPWAGAPGLGGLPRPPCSAPGSCEGSKRRRPHSRLQRSPPRPSWRATARRAGVPSAGCGGGASMALAPFPPSSTRSQVTGGGAVPVSAPTRRVAAPRKAASARSAGTSRRQGCRQASTLPRSSATATSSVPPRVRQTTVTRPGMAARQAAASRGSRAASASSSTTGAQRSRGRASTSSSASRSRASAGRGTPCSGSSTW